MCMEDSYTGIDDGECYYALVRCFGAAWHIVAVALQDENKLNAECAILSYDMISYSPEAQICQTFRTYS
jgi:hypothetical protein